MAELKTKIIASIGRRVFRKAARAIFLRPGKSRLISKLGALVTGIVVRGMKFVTESLLI